MQTTQTNRDTLIQTLADTYYDFLMSMPYNNDLYMAGIKEGKGKFLSNLTIHLAGKGNPPGWRDKRYTTDYVSPAALDNLKMHAHSGLDYEHIVPKDVYTLQVLEKKAQDGSLTRAFVRDHLAQYWWTATVTHAEHKCLSRKYMPDTWDKETLFARYDEAGIVLLPHRKDYFAR